MSSAIASQASTLSTAAAWMRPRSSSTSTVFAPAGTATPIVV